MGLTRQQRLQKIATALGIPARGKADVLQRRIEKERARRKAAANVAARRKPAVARKKKRTAAAAATDYDYDYRRRARDYDYRKRARDYHRQPRESTTEILRNCGPQCFADDQARHSICPKCDRYYDANGDEVLQCYCYPDCDLLYDSYTAKRDRDTMLRYGDMIGCDWANNISTQCDTLEAAYVAGSDTAADRARKLGCSWKPVVNAGLPPPIADGLPQNVIVGPLTVFKKGDRVTSRLTPSAKPSFGKIKKITPKNKYRVGWVHSETKKLLSGITIVVPNWEMKKKKTTLFDRYGKWGNTAKLELFDPTRVYLV
jgi:hypothetical protein